MATCPECGAEKESSGWDLIVGEDDTRCQRCIQADAKKSVRCLIPDRPIEKSEQLHDMTTGGAGRGSLRKATLTIRDGKLFLRAHVSGKAVVLTVINLQDVEELNILPFSVGKQMKMVLLRSIGWCSGLMALFVIILFSVFVLKGEGDIGGALRGILPIAALMAFLFSFLPGMCKIKRNLMAMYFLTKAKECLFIAVNPKQLITAQELLKQGGFKFI